MKPGLKKLIDERNKLLTDVDAELQRFEGNAAPPDVVENVERMHREIGDKNKKIELFGEQEKLAQQAAEFDSRSAGTGAGRRNAEETIAPPSDAIPGAAPDKRGQLNQGLKRYAVFGQIAPSDRVALGIGERSIKTGPSTSALLEGLGAEERAAFAGLDSFSGITIPRENWGGLVEAIKTYGTLRLMGAQVEQTTFSDAVPYTTSDTTNVEGEWLREGQPATMAADHEQGSDMIGLFDLSSKIRTLSEKRIADPAFDFLGWLTEICGLANERSLQKGLAVGSGLGMPLGFTKTVVVGRTAAAQNAIVSDDIYTVFHSIDEAYRNRLNARWAMRDETLLAIRLLKGTDGHPLFQTNMREGQPELLLGKPYHNLGGLDAIGAAKKPVFFGDWSAMKIRDGVGPVGPTLVVFKERFAERKMRGILLFTSAGGGYINVGNPLKCLKMAD